jgi:hypothetical protein
MLGKQELGGLLRAMVVSNSPGQHLNDQALKPHDGVPMPRFRQIAGPLQGFVEWGDSLAEWTDRRPTPLP